MDTLTDRLQSYMDYKGLNFNQITTQAGLSVGLIGKAIKTNKGLHSDTIEKIVNTYPDLNPEWLISGRGKMIKDVAKGNARRHDIPVYPIENNRTHTRRLIQLDDEEFCNDEISDLEKEELFQRVKEMAKRSAFRQRLLKVNRVESLYSRIDDFIYDLDLCTTFVKHYSISLLNKGFDDFFSNKASMEQLMNTFKANTEIIKELDKLTSPHYQAISKLYADLNKFNDIHDRVYRYDDIDECLDNDINNTTDQNEE